MLSSSYPCRVTGELHLFMEFLQVLPKPCPGSPLKWSWDTALLLLLPSEGFMGATEGDSAAQAGQCEDTGIPGTPHRAGSTSCARCFYPNEVASLSATGNSHIAEPRPPALVWALDMDGTRASGLGGWKGGAGGGRVRL